MSRSKQEEGEDGLAQAGTNDYQPEQHLLYKLFRSKEQRTLRFRMGIHSLNKTDFKGVCGSEAAGDHGKDPSVFG